MKSCLLSEISIELAIEGDRQLADLLRRRQGRLRQVGAQLDAAQLAVEGADLRQLRLHALKRIASPDEIARSVLYLASDAAAFTTGTAMVVDGGVSINRT
jgi:NAD(P)-dependent dehydrogenase (short-subunit alcohol dehydrogenase family)